jgi:tryptophan synthase beta chain
MLYPNVEELRQEYLKITAEPDFKAQFDQLLKDLWTPQPTLFCNPII